MSHHLDTLSWFWASQSLLLLIIAAYLAEKQQIPILYSVLWHDQGLHPRQASTLTFVWLYGTSENWRRTSRFCITVVQRDKWNNDCPTNWRLFSMIKMCCFVIFADLSFVNNYFNVFQNIGFHWSTLSLITTMNQEIFRTYTWSVSFQRFH